MEDSNIISIYSRQQAIDDGLLIDVSTTAREAGIRFPTAITDTVWNSCVKVPPGITGQDELGRLWDILWMLRYGISRQPRNASQVLFELSIRNTHAPARDKTMLKAVIGPRFVPRPVITIMWPDED